MKKIGIIASGGNSQAMNNTVIAIVKQAYKNNLEPYLIKDGYCGVLRGDFKKAVAADLDAYINRGNVMIGSARCLEFLEPKNQEKAAGILKKNGIEVLIVIGGDGSYNGAYKLSTFGTKVIALPGTIDNDISSTEYSIGFDTCLNQIILNMDALKDSFESHNGICFVEVMGRHFSELAIRACIANNAQYVVTSDNVLNAKQFAKIANDATKNGVRGVMFVITENIYGKDGLPTLSAIAEEVGKLTNNQMSRAISLGHIQRGGTPTANDRFMSSLFGAHAITCIKENVTNVAIGFRNNKLVTVDIKKAVTMPRKKHCFYFFDKSTI
ncbi:MAG: ATP-dependent 6-phosphofructokinase [Mycoplasmataceae bacterium]|jgi:6-phosphofructokinase 1|nr:ATP-dependent 6-phosphofructokinase [Mycoplasmataceae bacterium]